ncbi:MAG: hypothetical protein QF894_12480 [Alphaproteobacteria bacterium]|nr:hypothetical protein [Alphaproteobacteria bacterium]|tara:strand:- start:1517 stop:1792 length:276 start_codon:yes stop_codon:yes gene_type:complete
MANSGPSGRPAGSGTATPASAEDLRHLLGDIEAEQAAEILKLGASYEDIEVALTRADGESDVMANQRKPLSGLAGAVYEIITADTDIGEER